MHHDTIVFEVYHQLCRQFETVSITKFGPGKSAYHLPLRVAFCFCFFISTIEAHFKIRSALSRVCKNFGWIESMGFG